MQPQLFARTVQESEEWLRILTELSEERSQKGTGGTLRNKEKALAALRATLKSLRDRMTVEEAAHFGAQLPILIRGIYYEGWRPTDLPIKVRSWDEFVELFRHHIGQHPEIEPMEAMACVLQLLEQRMSNGEIDQALAQFPAPIRENLNKFIHDSR